MIILLLTFSGGKYFHQKVFIQTIKMKISLVVFSTSVTVIKGSLHFQILQLIK